MGSTQPMSINTGLGTLPFNIQNIAEVYQEIVKIYSAIRNIVNGYDITLGLTELSPSEQTSAGYSRINLGNFPKMYLFAYEDIAPGKTVELINTSSTECKVKLGTDGKVVGFCSNAETVVTGDLCEVTLQGLFPTLPDGTLIPGRWYYQSGTPGSMGLSGTGVQFLGFALSDTKLLFIPEHP